LSLFSPKTTLTARARSPYVRLSIVGGVLLAALMVLWLGLLLKPAAESTSASTRAEAIGQTVRCPVCVEPIPVNDEQNPASVAMRAFILQQVQRGHSGDEVRAQLAARYGSTILLAPPLSGFDLAAWLVPVAVFIGAAAAVGLAARRWIVPSSPPPLVAAGGPPDEATRRYEDLLDRELARR